MNANNFRVFRCNLTGINYQKVVIGNKKTNDVTAVLLTIGGKTTVEVNDEKEGVQTVGTVQILTTDLYSKSDDELVELAYHIENVVC